MQEEVLSRVNNKIGRLEEKFNHSIVSQSLIQILSLSESVESTRIEGTLRLSRQVSIEKFKIS